jgi:5-methylcytosine-specific restriction endonuclease McrA
VKHYTSGRAADESLPRSEGKGASVEGNLGILGEASAAADEPPHPPGSSALDLRSLRPGQLLSILNSTSLGRVISERQLLRDRQHAGLISAARVNLLQYMARLRNERSIKAHNSDAYRRFQKQRRRSRRASTAPSHDEVFSLLERQQYRCALTGHKLTPDTASLDHILPVCRQGAHTIDNAQIVLKEVNRAKGTLTNEEFIALCRAVVRHADKTARHSLKETK